MRQPPTLVVDLYQGDDQQILGEALLAKTVAEQEAARKPEGNARAGDDGETPDEAAQQAADDYAAILAEVTERMTHVRVRQIGRTKWRGLLAAHPPRENDKQDERNGFNNDTFPPAVIDQCLVEVTDGDGEPEKLAGNERAEWIEDLGEGETNAVFEAAFHLNENKPTPPKVLPLVGHFGATGR